MKPLVKVLLGVAGAAGVGYGAYRIYKWWKEEEELEADGLSYDELVAQAEAKQLEEEAKEREARMIENEKHLRELEGLPDDGLDWFKTDDGFIRRELSPYEVNFGPDYDPLTEEIIQEMNLDGLTNEYVQKLDVDKTRFYNYREADRPIRDIVESVEDMARQIKTLKGADMEHDRLIYDKNTSDAYDYYKALVLDRYGITDKSLRRDLIALFSWEFLPNKTKVGDWGRREDIIARRIEYFTFGNTYIDFASVAEAILEYADRLSTDTGDIGTVQEFAGWIVETLGLDFESDIDPVIHDTLVSYIEHDRGSKRANDDGTYGLFHISKEDYDKAESLYRECGVAIGDILEGKLEPELYVYNMEEDDDDDE